MKNITKQKMIYLKGFLHMKDKDESSGIQKSEERLSIIEKIKEYEKAGTFDIDVENDPPAPVLMPDKVDYMRKKIINKIDPFFFFLSKLIIKREEESPPPPNF